MRLPVAFALPSRVVVAVVLLGTTASLMVPIAGCLSENQAPRALREARTSGGPRIIFNLEERPFPEIPFPNDLATRPDPSSPTGVRLNVSERGGVKAEERVRREINRQSGFGLYSPITVRFDAQLDLHRIVERHQEPVPNFADDVVYVVNIDPDSEGYGELVLLDMGRGNFPHTLEAPGRYFANDVHREGTNLLFETRREEDTNGNGLLDPIEDLDDDGVWDEPNTLDPGADPLAVGQLLTFYERETNTLIMRPTEPLRAGTTYAVVLTNQLLGTDLRPIDSPFEGVNHTRQTPQLEALREILPARLPQRFDTTLDGVRFAWSFTTHEPTRALEAIRAGLYGHGSLAWLSEQFPAEIELLHDVHAGTTDNPMIFRMNELIPLLAPLVSEATSPASGEAIAGTFEDVDYIVSGSFLSPHFLVDSDGLALPIPDASQITPGDHLAIDRLEMHEDDESFDIDLDTGKARVRADEVPFLCIIPKPTPAQQAPFPTIIYSHAISSTRFEGLVFAGVMAKFGMATCTIDSVGHGVAIPREFKVLLGTLATRFKLRNLPAVLAHHRARDIDNDGEVDSGGDYFTTDLLHSRDNIRQSIVDHMQLVRLLRSFDGVSRFGAIKESSPYVVARRDVISAFDANGDGTPELRGDFNGDGVVDLGGDVSYVSWGTSLGGIHTSVLAGVEPTVRAMASNAGGGGLMDVAARTSISNVRVGALLRTLGPLLIGEPRQVGGEPITELSWILPRVTSDIRVPFARVADLEDGDVIVLRNLARERSPFVTDHDLYSRARVREGRFRTGIATDAESGPARRARQGVVAPRELVSEVLDCPQGGACVNATCTAGRTCKFGGCIPIAQCIDSFDGASRLDAEQDEALVVRDPGLYGDRLEVQIYAASGELKHRITTFEMNAVYEGLLYPKGAPLAALAEGWGIARQTPRLRRFWGIGQMLLEPADPVIWASRYQRESLQFPYEREAFQSGATQALIVGTLGDQTVPIDTAMALGRAVGAINMLDEDDRYGATGNQYLVHNYVYEGIAGLNRFPDHPGMLYDPDDLDRGAFRSQRDGRSSPESDAPLRATRRTPQGGLVAFRLPYLNERGEHTFNAPNPDLSFDIHTFMLNQVGWFLAHGGRRISDDPCMAANIHLEQCPWFDPATFTPSFD